MKRKKRKKKKAFTLIELLVVIAIIALLMGILMPALSKARQLAIQLVCGTSLKGLGSAMLVYSSYSDDDYPRAGGAGSTWASNGIILSWIGGTGRNLSEDRAFGTIRDASGEVTTPGRATITSSWYLLIKHAKVTPKQFVCKGDGALDWPFKQYNSVQLIGMDMTRAWDFGSGGYAGRGRTGPQLPYPGEVVSYTYQMPYSPGGGSFETFVIVDQSNPGSPMAADRSPFSDKLTSFTAEPGDNSASHQGKGQNVLYKDGHLKFETSSNVGIGDDNIYTYRTDSGEAGPTDDGDLLVFPFDDQDAVLVGERNGRTGG